MSEKIRLNKFISDSGVCSRREADKYIETGHVTINGRRAKIGDMVSPDFDKVLLSGNLVEARDAESFVLMAFNKPVGLVSTTEIGAKDSGILNWSLHERQGDQQHVPTVYGIPLFVGRSQNVELSDALGSSNRTRHCWLCIEQQWSYLLLGANVK